MENSKGNNAFQLTNKSTAEKNTKDKNKQKDSIIFQIRKFLFIVQKILFYIILNQTIL